MSDTKAARDRAVQNVVEVYDGVIRSTTREPITIFLQKEQNAEALTKLVVALNGLVKAYDDDAGREIGDKITTVRDAILEDLKARFKAGDKSVLACRDTSRWHKPQANYFHGAGKMKCPLCAGELRYSRAGYNGHIHAACSTEGCVRWME